MRPLAEAQHHVIGAVGRLPAVEVPLAESAGLVLAAEVHAPHDIPPFANSAMDGYAVLAADLIELPALLEVLEDVAAGSVPTRAVGRGQAIKIMTGAPMPAGADTVVQVEHTDGGSNRVAISVATEAGTAVRPAGSDLAAGTLVLDTGTRLGPAHLATLASIGEAQPRVYRRPRVAVFSTGDELRPYETPQLAPGQIRDTNRLLIQESLRELGTEVLDLGIIGDNADQLRAVLADAAERADAVTTSGGVSMGEYDLVKEVLSELGGVEFWQVAIQPAKPFAFGSIAGTPFFGLPGNPVSVFVAYEQFLRPALLHMMGSPALFRPRVEGILDEPVDTNPEKTVFLRVNVAWHDGDAHARLSGGQGSHVLSALASADALAVVPAGVASINAGEPVVLEMFRWPEERRLDELEA
jgi:molybdenum cofactor synthesis domain-containing protein